jgi:NADPH:quinone reductase-like Zn-dependent oxidoreductase
MKRRYKILGGACSFLAVLVLVLALYVGHDSACPAPPAPLAGVPLMKAVVHRCYGGPEVLKLEVVAKPPLVDNKILVRVHAASANPLDWHYMRGLPYLVRVWTGIGVPKHGALGVDFAGTVEAVGAGVKRFKPGDEVYGAASGAFAEYVSMPEDGAVTPKPANISFEQAAAVPIAGLTALQALRDVGRVQRGQKVLINGAAGGVGTFAVQIAKSMGAEVTGVCSTRNVPMVRSIGADHVIDYSAEDFTESTLKYDLIFDTVGNRSMSALRGVMAPKAIAIQIGGRGPQGEQWLWPIVGALEGQAYSWFVSQSFASFLARQSKEDLAILGTLMQTGKLTPVIDRRYPLAETSAAIAYLEAGHARGKVVIIPE